MKKVLHNISTTAMLVVLLLIFVTGKANAQVQIGNFFYTFPGNGEATITATTIGSGDLVIPTTVQYGGNTYNVTAINFGTANFTQGVTSITGNSIKRITGQGDRVGYVSSISQFCDGRNITKVSFPVLETIEMCGFMEYAPKLTTVELPALTKIDKATIFNSCQMLTTLELPKLKEMNSQVSIYGLGSLKTLKLPSLTKITGSGNNIYNLAELETIDLSSLKIIDTSGSLSELSKLETLNLPELEEITPLGFNALGSLTSMKDLRMPKLMHIRGQQFMLNSNLSVINLPYGCEIDVNWGSFGGNNSTSSLTITGVTKVRDTFFASRALFKHLHLPDVKEFSGQIGNYIDNVESIDMPNLTKISNCSFFNRDQYNGNLTTVNLPKLTDITGSELFNGAPIKELTLRSDITDGGSGKIHLTAYPTVVKIVETGTVNDNTTLFSDVKGERMIVPEGKAALYATKWHLPLAKMMVYSPGKISKTTAATLYATGSIAQSLTETTDGATTYTNAYDLRNAMTKADCLNAEVLGPNDAGFTPSLATLSVSAYNNPFTTLDAYTASAYVDDAVDRQKGDLTLTPLNPAAIGTVQGFAATAATTYEGMNATTGGFIFKDNATAFDELYLPYTATAMTAPATNYFKAGDGNSVPRKSNGNFNFYWHPGDASYNMGFYMSTGVVVPEGRAYLALPTSSTTHASAKSFRLIFDDNTTTGISTVNTSELHENGYWYTLEGIRLREKPTRAGLYIHNGKKVVLK